MASNYPPGVTGNEPEITGEPTPCPEGCTNTTPPYCHCIDCGESGVPLNARGVCADCTRPRAFGQTDY